MDSPVPSMLRADPALQETLSYDGMPTPDAPAGVAVPSDLPRGTIVNRYTILERVGEGGMGVVYAAYDPTLDRRVALKFLAAEQAARDGIRERRLLREAQAMARLSHPNVVVVYEVGTFHGHVFLAMEFVDGVDLRRWLAQESRTQSEIMDMFRAAGRGLAAAHAAGIIHRDFKPENVLVDRTGRPRVTDFGLSRAAHDPEVDVVEPAGEGRETARSAPGHLATPLTTTGSVIGTPMYMAPEQHVGDTVDERSDQFSFCVALYEALYRAHPFEGALTERRGNAIAGRIAPAPAQSSVPSWCREVLLRGLAPTPADRFPSTEALLAALSPRPSRRPRVAIAVSLGLLMAAGAAYAIFFDRSVDSSGPRCDAGARRLAGIWDDARQRLLRSSFLRAGGPGADVTWRSFSAIVNARAEAWTAMSDQACSATHVDGTQSPAVLDLRMECLDRKRQEMKSLVDVYSENPDPAALDRAVRAADKLSSVSACADIDNLRAVVALPDDPAIRARVASLRQRLSDSRALYDAGRYQQGRDYLATLKEEVDAVGYAPLAAGLANELASHLSRAGDTDEAAKLLFAAAMKAVEGRDWHLEADVWLSLLGTYADSGDAKNGLLASHMAAVAVERAHADDALRGRLANSAGAVEYDAGHLDEALRQFLRAADLWKRSLGPNSPSTANALGNAGDVLIELGRIRDGLEHLERSLAIKRATLRPDHPSISNSMSGIASAYYYLGLYREARETAQAAADMSTRALGPDHTVTIFAQGIAAVADTNLGNIARALKLLSAMTASLEKRDKPDEVLVSATRVATGDAQRRAGLLREAERTLQKAIADNARAGLSEHPATGDAWTALGQVHNARRRHRQALGACRRALEILSRGLVPDSSMLLLPRECIGEALIGIGDMAGARKELERAVTPVTAENSGPQRTAGVHFQLARALWPTPGERARARQLARASLDALTAAQGDNRELVGHIAAWLKIHGEPSTD